MGWEENGKETIEKREDRLIDITKRRICVMKVKGNARKQFYGIGWKENGKEAMKKRRGQTNRNCREETLRYRNERK